MPRLLRTSKKRIREYLAQEDSRPVDEEALRLPAGDPKAERFWRDPKDGILKIVAPWMEDRSL